MESRSLDYCWHIVSGLLVYSSALFGEERFQISEDFLTLDLYCPWWMHNDHAAEIPSFTIFF